MKSETALQRFCVFCLKEREFVTVFNAKHWQVLGNFTEGQKSFNERNVNEKKFSLCSDCGVVVNTFLELFEEWEFLRLKLEWKLETLLDIVTLSGRIPTRLTNMKETCVMVENGETFLSDLKAFRFNFKKKAKQKLSRHQPRTLLERCQPSYQNLSHKSAYQSSDEEMPSVENIVLTSFEKGIVTKSEPQSGVLETEEHAANPDSDTDQIDDQIENLPTENEIEQEDIETHHKLSSTEFQNCSTRRTKLKRKIKGSEETQTKILTPDAASNNGSSKFPNARITQTIFDGDNHSDHQTIENDNSRLKTEPSPLKSHLTENEDENDLMDGTALHLEQCKKGNNSLPEHFVDSAATCAQNDSIVIKESPKKSITVDNNDSDELMSNHSVDHEYEPQVDNVSSDDIESDNSEEEKPPKSKQRGTAKKSRKGKKRNTLFGFMGRRHKCTVDNCPEKFCTEDQLKIHETHHGSFKCQYCKEVINYAPDMCTHVLEIHSPKEPIKSRNGHMHPLRCPTCPYHCKTNRDFTLHYLRIHMELENASVQCHVCKATFAKTENLRKHFRNLHDTAGLDESEIFRCEQCPAYFTKSLEVVRHTAQQHLPNKTCPVCKKRFADFKCLKDHMRSIHPEDATDFGCKFVCGIGNCKRVLTTQKFLDEHRERCTAKQSVKSYVCETCGREFKLKSTYHSHRFSVHSITKQICPHCGKTFKNTTVLKTHMEYHKDPAEWKFKCTECGKKFADKQKLQQHLRTHTKEKPFVCHYCGLTYGHRHNWKAHMKKQHPEAEEGEIEIRDRSTWNYVSRKGSKKGQCLTSGTSKE